jgi:hypothetical protein
MAMSEVRTSWVRLGRNAHQGSRRLVEHRDNAALTTLLSRQSSRVRHISQTSSIGRGFFMGHE